MDLLKQDWVFFALPDNFLLLIIVFSLIIFNNIGIVDETEQSGLLGSEILLNEFWLIAETGIPYNFIVLNDIILLSDDIIFEVLIVGFHSQ